MKKLSLIELSEKFKSKELSPVEYSKDIIQLLKEDTYNAIISFDENSILTRSKEAEHRYIHGTPLSQIDGIPIGIKDIIDTKNLYTTYGCDAYRKHMPQKDAYIVETLKKTGAITDIKTNTCQFALGPTGEYCLDGAVRNPHNPQCYSGGSSAGSAAAVAAGLLPAAIGTDSGGSIRMPSSLCGLVGMKPTYSIISNAGIMPVSDSVDTVGVLTNSVKDNALLLEMLISYNNKDWRQSYPPYIHYSYRIGESIKGSKIGIIAEFFNGCIDSEVAKGCMKAVDELQSLGVTIYEKKLPDLRELREAHQLSMLAFAHSIHVKDIENYSEYIYPQVMARLQRGNISSTQYVQLERKKKELINILFDALDETECLVYPTTPLTAYKIGEGENKITVGGVETTPYASTGATTWIGSFSGMPCLSIPAGKTKKGLPYGLTLMGRPHDEANLYRIADQLLKTLI